MGRRKSLPKALSFNGRARSSNGAKGSRFHELGYVPSFSNVLHSGLMAHTHKTKSKDEEIESIIRNLKKLRMRIKKTHMFLPRNPDDDKTEEQKEARRKLSRWEGLATRQEAILTIKHIEHQRISEREDNKLRKGEDVSNSKNPSGFSKDNPWYVTDIQNRPGNMEPIGMNKVIVDAIDGSKPDLGLVKDRHKALEVTDKKASNDWNSIVQERKKQGWKPKS